MSTPTRYDDHPLAERVRENLAELAEATLVLRRWDEVPVVSMVPRARRRWVVAVLAAVVAAALVVATVVVVRVATGGRSVKPATPSGAEAPSRFVFDPPEGFSEGESESAAVAREAFACVEYKIEAGAVRCDAVSGRAAWGSIGDETTGTGASRGSLAAYTYVAQERADLGNLTGAKVVRVRGHEGRLVVGRSNDEDWELVLGALLAWEEQPGVLVTLGWSEGVPPGGAEYPGDAWMLEIAASGHMEALGAGEGLWIALEHRSIPWEGTGVSEAFSDIEAAHDRFSNDPFGTGRKNDWLVVHRGGDGVRLDSVWSLLEGSVPELPGSSPNLGLDIDTPLGNRVVFDYELPLPREDRWDAGAFGAVPADAARVRVELHDGQTVEVDARGADLGYGAAFFRATWSGNYRFGDEKRRIKRVVALAANGRELAHSVYRMPRVRHLSSFEPRTFSTLETPPQYTEGAAIATQGTADGMAWKLVVRPIERGWCLGFGAGEPTPTTCIDEAGLDNVLNGAPLGLWSDDLGVVAGLVPDRAVTVSVVLTSGLTADVTPVRPSEALADPELLAFAVEVPAGESVERIEALDDQRYTEGRLLASAKPIVPAGG